jgi:lipopolysaccharide/colanic/teichoic acid biosynthesis glycosyltransferase
MKRVLDISIAILGLLITSPVLIPVCILISLQDFGSPFYIASRVGKHGKPFKMVKLRSMVVNADKSGVDSTSSQDRRITPIGKFIRAYKLDELSQLWNVLKGDMSLVGPRPNVQREVDLYTEVEKNLLKVQPGITDISSIVFSDEGEILQDSSNPDLDYNQLIRPWKSRLGLLYVEHQSFWLDIKLILLTIVAIFSREIALREMNKVLVQLDADEKLIQVAKRQDQLTPFPPPGSKQIVSSR